MTRLILLLLLILILTGAAAACSPAANGDLPAAPTATPQPTATATATIVWFPPTSTPTPQPTREFIPTPTPQLGIDRLMLSDDFTSRDTWATRRTAIGSVAYGVDDLTLAVATAKGYLVGLRHEPQLDDFYLEITASPSLCRDADQYGLLLRASDEWNYYRWVLTCDGRTRLEKVKQGAIALVQDWIESPQVPAGAGVDVRLAVWMYGAEMRFYISGVEQFSTRDGLWQSGRPGVYIRAAGDPPLTVSFDDLSVWSLDRAVIPTPTRPPTITPQS
ncbi:MAG: hypothetical protein AB1453_08805 [Chloroflexota bacterium]